MAPAFPLADAFAAPCVAASEWFLTVVSGSHLPVQGRRGRLLWTLCDGFVQSEYRSGAGRCPCGCVLQNGELLTGGGINCRQGLRPVLPQPGRCAPGWGSVAPSVRWLWQVDFKGENAAQTGRALGTSGITVGASHFVRIILQLSRHSPCLAAIATPQSPFFTSPAALAAGCARGLVLPVP